MTRAERLAAKEAADKQKLEDSRKALALTQAALREATRKATNKRRYQVGAMADDAGLLAWSNAELGRVFAALARFTAIEHPGAVLETLLGDPDGLAVGVGNGGAEARPRVSATP